MLVLDAGGDGVGDAARTAAQQWAAREASRRRVPLHVLVPRDDVAAARTVHRLREAHPGLAVHLRSLPAPVDRSLTRLTHDAALLVLPFPATAVVLSSAGCPTAVVPAGEPERGKVIVGVAPWTGSEVLHAAVEQALGRHAELVAVRAWSSRLVDLGRVLPAMLTRWDDRAARAERELLEALRPWREASPALRLHPLVVHDDAAPLLTSLSGHAELLVVGRSGRGGLTRTLAGAPAAAVVAAAHCPVLVVPGPDTGGRPARRKDRTAPLPA
ncbi:universal stress protein [Pseudonocardia sp. RS11V-5]|uniref:universal stress protein n=1 Tax=Pseudonocardia terrae TaxID=2905831 RepID=UPI001E32CC0A|nr:universal stress protein [Pseudonocardia terrae]MCE3553135.1 universal stress protein [Pseudonocardia terrae]